MKILAHWLACEKDFDSIYWLIPDEGHFKQRELLQQRAQQQIKLIQKHLASYNNLLEDYSIRPFEQEILNRYEAYLQFFPIELNPFDSNIKRVKEVANDANFHLKNFLARLKVRALIRQASWQLANQELEKFVFEFPWSSQLRSYQVLVYYMQRDYHKSKIATDAAHIVSEEESNAFLNYMTLYIYNVNQELFELTGQMSQDNLQRSRTLTMIEFLRPYFRSLRQDISKNKAASMDWQKLYQKLLGSKNKDVQNLLIENLLKSKDLEKILSFIQDQPKRDTSLVQNFQMRLSQKIEEQRKLKIQQLLIRYSILFENQYLLPIIQLGEEGHEILFQILDDESTQAPLRLLAGMGLIKMADFTVFQKMRKKITGNNTCSIIVASALQLEGHYILNADERSKVCEPQSENQSEFLQLLKCALFEKDQIHLLQSKALSPYPLVSLFAALRLHEDNPQLLFERKYQSHFCQFWNSPSPYVRMYWNRFIWIFHYRCSKQDFRSDFWKSYGEIMFNGLEDKNEFVQIDAFKIASAYFSPEVVPSFYQKKAFNIINEYTKSKSTNIQVWSGYLVGKITPPLKVADMLKNSEKGLMLRFGMLLGVLQSENYRDLSRIIANLFRNKSPMEDDSLIKRLLCYLIGFQVGERRESMGFIAGLLRDLVKKGSQQSKKIYPAYIGSLFWSGTKEDIPELVRCLKSKDENLQAIAGASLVSVVKTLPLSQWRKLLKLLPPSSKVREAAAWAMHYHVKSHFRREKEFFSSDKYLLYLESLENVRSKKMLYQAELAYKLFPHGYYAYEVALLYYLQRNIDKSYEFLKLTQSMVDDDSTSIKNSRSLLRSLCLELEGKLASLNNQHKANEDFLRKAVANYPFHYRFSQELAKCLERQNKSLESEKYYWKTYLAGKKDSLDSILSLYLKTGQKDKAIQALKQYPLYLSQPRDYYLYHQELKAITKDIELKKLEDFFTKEPTSLLYWEVLQGFSKQTTIEDVDLNGVWKKFPSSYITSYDTILVQYYMGKSPSTFLRTYIYSSQKREVSLEILFKDRGNIWLNRKLLISKKSNVRKYQQHKSTIILEKGKNEIIVCVMGTVAKKFNCQLSDLSLIDK